MGLFPLEWKPKLPVAVAYSGGADSTALLLAVRERWPGQVLAIHVNHGLQDAAADFEAHCVAACARLNVPLIVASLKVRVARGQSPEDAARRARRQAIAGALLWFAGSASPEIDGETGSFRLFATEVEKTAVFTAMNREANSPSTVDTVALAQHADDQAETVLLALSRGAGLGGLSGMPATIKRLGLCWYRPLLSVRRRDLEAWLHERGETWVDDPSNTCTDFTRNRIRHEVMPALEAALPGFAGLAARSAQHMAQAQRLLSALGELDLADLGVPPRLGKLQTLSADRRANALRFWLEKHHETQASTAQLAELQKQIMAATTRGHTISMRVGRGRVRYPGSAAACLEYVV